MARIVRRSSTRHRIPNAGGRWLRIADAAAESLFSPSHIRRAIRIGALKAYRVTGGREVRILRDDLDAFIRGDQAKA